MTPASAAENSSMQVRGVGHRLCVVPGVLNLKPWLAPARAIR
jgi:hypothetical protein